MEQKTDDVIDRFDRRFSEDSFGRINDNETEKTPTKETVFNYLQDELKHQREDITTMLEGMKDMNEYDSIQDFFDGWNAALQDAIDKLTK